MATHRKVRSPNPALGTLNTLPKEIRQMIYQHVLETSKPIVIQGRCTLNPPGKPPRECKKHPKKPDQRTSRFNLLRVSKTLCSEASWALTNTATISLNVAAMTTPCSASLPLPDSIVATSADWRRATNWLQVAKFRHVTIDLATGLTRPFIPLRLGDIPILAFLLVPLWRQVDGFAPPPQRSVEVYLGGLLCGVKSWGTVCMRSAVSSLESVSSYVEGYDTARWRVTALMRSEEEVEECDEWLELIKAECGKYGVVFEVGVETTLEPVLWPFGALN